MYFIRVHPYHTNSTRNDLHEGKELASDSETDEVGEGVKVRIAECSRQLGTPIGLLSLNVILYSS